VRSSRLPHNSATVAFNVHRAPCLYIPCILDIAGLATTYTQWLPTALKSATRREKVQPSPHWNYRSFNHHPDVPTILALIQELAEYEKSSSSVDATVELLTRTLSHYDATTSSFSDGYAKTLLLTDPDGTIAGMALYFYNYSTWTGVPGIYLEDLFVKPEYRKRKYGIALLQALAQEVLKVGGKRLEWSCLDWNEPSLQFYQSEIIGAKKKTEWVGLRVEGDALGKLAGSS
jgi:GNAT superfamily N-acetyltransferase